MDVLRWAMVAAAVIHVAEEWRGGWLRWAQGYVEGVTLAHFVIINAAFIVLCFGAALVGAAYPVFGLSIASLVFINAFVHIVPAMLARRYTPGLISAVGLYLPLSSLAYYVALNSGQITLSAAIQAGLLGLGWMAVPVIFQGVRLSRVRGRGR